MEAEQDWRTQPEISNLAQLRRWRHFPFLELSGVRMVRFLSLTSHSESWTESQRKTFSPISEFPSMSIKLLNRLRRPFFVCLNMNLSTTVFYVANGKEIKCIFYIKKDKPIQSFNAFDHINSFHISLIKTGGEDRQP